MPLLPSLRNSLNIFLINLSNLSIRPACILKRCPYRWKWTNWWRLNMSASVFSAGPSCQHIIMADGLARLKINTSVGFKLLQKKVT